MEDNSYKDDSEGGSEVDLSGDTDTIDIEVEWRMVGESGSIEVVALLADGDEDKD